MANPIRGQASVVVDGREYILHPKVNALIALKAMTGKDFRQICAEVNEQDLEAIRALLWALLQEHHGEEIKRLEDAGDFLDRAGLATIEAAYADLDKANAGPASDAPPAPRVNGRPRRAQAGSIGGRSTSAPADTPV